MVERSETSPKIASPSWPRWAARGSLLAAFVCFAMNCVFMQLTRSEPPSETALANRIVGWSSMAIVVGGMAAGAAAMIGGWKTRDRDTLAIATLGFLLNCGIVLVTLWMLYQIGQARPQRVGPANVSLRRQLDAPVFFQDLCIENARPRQ